MMYLDLAEIDRVLESNPLWSRRMFSPVRFRRADYYGHESQSIEAAVRQKIQEELGFTPEGPIRMLSNLRFFGFIINPITIYYCFDSQEQLTAMLLEVTNTPWGERHQYVLNCDPIAKKQRISFEKDHHVSPFMPMSMQYEWFCNTPAASLLVHMNSRLNNDEVNKCFDATLVLKRREICSWSLFSILARFPVMTFKVFAGIYWQALKLFVKKLPIYPNPRNSALPL